MAQSSSLTTSGLLYEANWDEWLPRMQAALAQYRPHDKILTRRDRSGNLSVGYSGSQKLSAIMIWCKTSPHIKLRVPDSGRKHATKLLGTLHKLAQPFRVNELPPEIRLRVYRFSLPTCDFTAIQLLEQRTDNAGSERFVETSKGIVGSPLLSVNRQIRLEALPLYQNTVTSGLFFTRLFMRKPWPEPTNFERVSAVNG